MLVKGVPILGDHRLAYLWYTILYNYINAVEIVSFRNKFTEICIQWPNEQEVSIGSENGWAQRKQNAIIQTNDGPVYWHIYVSHGPVDLM